ncbi:MAG: cytochrome ubiquinol oxidase subunit I [Giesbergeria sp.]|uniref:cytochrome ubiquinol oxidase subunit I n=1 Tax=Giesbergeria sp. TaxID=2818473 RepID=UPI00262706F2|nr:cytochrome ubiquinol oxidase subunit I [Giesbergeria sp.]MDD2609863.1 cytochrome ubiquinol oxidase subunit I [Giesbergeria sp.]
MELDPLFLSRLQFAFVVSFHAIFPVFTIGLASYIAVLETIALRTGNPYWERLAAFWIKVFAVVFGMGVVSGLVMAFQFGTNWSNFSYVASNFLGPILAYEVVTAFFLEAAFLGVLLFGRHKVPPGLHLLSAYMVAIGTFISSFWILSANSWMQTPAGFEIRDGMVHVTSWVEAIFNPSFPYRFAHMALASFLTGGFVVAGVSALFVLRGHAVESAQRALKMTLVLLAIISPLQLLIGDMHGLNTLEHQPTKVAAMEGVWHTEKGAPLLLFALPDQAQETNHAEIGIPKGASIILKHDPEGEIKGLTEVTADKRPPVFMVFWSFRVMVGIGMLMILVGLVGAWLVWRGKLLQSRAFLRMLTFMIPAPFIAVLAGWFVTEIGRQPYLIYGVMTAEQALTPSLQGWMALLTLIGYAAVYAVVFTSGIYYLRKVINQGITEVPAEGTDAGRPKRPLSAAELEQQGLAPSFFQS